MSRNIWTNEQKEMLHSSMTNEEIAQATGRSLASVKRGRYYYTGHEVEFSKWQLAREAAILEHEQKARRVANEERLKNLCKQLGVRLYG